MAVYLAPGHIISKIAFAWIAYSSAIERRQWSSKGLVWEVLGPEVNVVSRECGGDSCHNLAGAALKEGA